MTVSTALTLIRVIENPGITQTEIVASEGTEPASTSRHVAILGPHNPSRDEGLGLITVGVDPADRRRHLLYPSARAYELESRITKLIASVQSGAAT